MFIFLFLTSLKRLPCEHLVHILSAWILMSRVCKSFLNVQGTVLHFLHTDSVEGLGLSLERGIPRKKYITAEIVEKEYCQVSTVKFQ
jgi:hypothetical protein